MRIARFYIGSFVPAQLSRIDEEVRALDDCGMASEQILLHSDKLESHRLSEKAKNLSCKVISLRERTLFRRIMTAARHIRNSPPDRMHCHNWPALFFARMALLAAKRKSLVILEIHGAGAFEALYKDSRPLPRIIKFMVIYILENLAIIGADRILLVSKSIEVYYPLVRFRKRVAIPRVLREKRSEDKDGDVFRSECVETVAVFCNAARSENKLVIVYAGSAARWQLPRQTANLMNSLLRSRKAVGIILSNDIEVFESMIADDVRDACLVMSVTQREVQGCLRYCDVGLLLREKIALNAVASPTKLFEYLLAGLCVLTTDGIKDALAFVPSRRTVVIKEPFTLADEGEALDLVQSLRNVVQEKDLSSEERKYLTWEGQKDNLKAMYL